MFFFIRYEGFFNFTALMFHYLTHNDKALTVYFVEPRII